MSIEVRKGSIREVFECSLSIPEFTHPYDEQVYRQRLSKDPMVLVASFQKQVVGFKVGYDKYMDTKTYYSWMGGVIPEFRSQGVAGRLLQVMEKECKLLGYQFLSFKTLNKHKSMQFFALKNGFDIIGFKPMDTPDHSKIYYRKKL